MGFVKRYGIGAIFLLVAYGMFILGGIGGFQRITGNAIIFYERSNNLFFYMGYGVGLVLLFVIVWFIIKIKKKKRKKKQEKRKKGKTIKKVELISEPAKEEDFEDEEISSEKGVDSETKIVEGPKKESKILGFLKFWKEEEIPDMLIKGGRSLVNNKIKDSEKIYHKIQKYYNPQQDVDKKLYKRIMNYYNNILKKKKK